LFAIAEATLARHFSDNSLRLQREFLEKSRRRRIIDLKAKYGIQRVNCLAKGGCSCH
jgi:hypothetical protein